jgi:hypothetical protein
VLSASRDLPFAEGNGWDGTLSARGVSLRRGIFSRVRRRVWLGTALSVFAGALSLAWADAPLWPEPAALPAVSIGAEDELLVRAQRVCVLSARQSAGELGKSLVIRHRREGDLLRVSYFVYWSSERPWGHRSLFESLAIDAFYSHFLFVLPGIRHAMYGPGDVEGVTIVYRKVGGRLQVVEGFGDDEWHNLVRLGRDDLTDHGSDTVLLTTVWSHQLGARGAARLRGAPEPGMSERCFQGNELVPLTADIAERFWLGTAEAPRRARFAWL